MAARIVNHLQPQTEGSLYPSEAAARAALDAMIKRFEQLGMVTETEDKADGGPWHTVRDKFGQLAGIYYVTLD